MTIARSDTTVDVSEADRLRALVEEHSGNRSAIARALSAAGEEITRQGVTARLRKHKLLSVADEKRLTAGVSGPNVGVTKRAEGEERGKLLDALAGAVNYDAAAPGLGMSVATLFRKIKRHGITPAQVANRRRRLARAAKPSRSPAR